jgi:hypothetical protein
MLQSLRRVSRNALAIALTEGNAIAPGDGAEQRRTMPSRWRSSAAATAGRGAVGRNVPTLR